MYISKVNFIKLAVIQKRIVEFQTTCDFNNSAELRTFTSNRFIYLFFFLFGPELMSK